jgi:NAD/NADP transhydrogenase beta subunit
MESASTSSSTSIITPEDVLESLMNDGTIDALRLKIINQLKANVRSSPFPSFFVVVAMNFHLGFVCFCGKLFAFLVLIGKLSIWLVPVCVFKFLKALLVKKVYFVLLFVSMESYFFYWKIVNLMRIHLCFQVV